MTKGANKAHPLSRNECRLITDDVARYLTQHVIRGEGTIGDSMTIAQGVILNLAFYNFPAEGRLSVVENLARSLVELQRNLLADEPRLEEPAQIITTDTDTVGNA